MLSGIVFAADRKRKSQQMHPDISNEDLQIQLALYNEEIDKLKEKLLNGVSWEELKPVRRNISELAIAIQRSYGIVVTAGPGAEPPAGVSDIDRPGGEPARPK